MASRKDKQSLVDCDARIKEIRLQLGDQIKCLDQHTESRTTLINDIQDFFKRKSEIESEYARKLDVLSEKYLTKQKNLYSIKKEQPDLGLQSPVLCWFQMLEQCQRESKDHAMISNIYVNQVIPRLQGVIEDCSRLHKQTREITLSSHEDLLKDLRKLYQAMQLYQVYWIECVQAESKLKQVEKQFDKRNEKTLDSPKMDNKVKRSTSFRKLEKLKEKRLVKYSESKLKSVKARNEYILQLEATNAALKKYYGSDVGGLLDTMAIGYHSSLERMWQTYCGAERSAQHSRVDGIELLRRTVKDLDHDSDKKKFLDNNNNSFSTPTSFQFTGYTGDEVRRVSLALPQLHREIDKRCCEMESTVNQMTTDEEELKKTISASHQSIEQLLSTVPTDITASFIHMHHGKDLSPFSALRFASPPPSYINKEFQKTKAKLLDTEIFYLEKFEEFLKKSNQLNRLQARHITLEKALSEEVPVADTNTFSRSAPSVAPKPRKKGFGRRKRSKANNLVPSLGHFSTNLQSYLKESGRSIPLVVESCIRVINLYGLHHLGIFRVPGSHQEITELKNLFEGGEDPVSEREDEVDINSVAGLLKLYFRQLDEKLFPRYVFDDLVQCVHLANIDERVPKIRKIILNIPESVLIVMRYLFQFLNHLSQNSDENMMDAYNIAVCFGPTLLPVPDNYDQVTCQANVNEIIKTIVLHHEEIFPAVLDGPVYEKVMASEEFVGDEAAIPDPGADPAIQEQHSPSAHSSISDDDSEQLFEGIARYDYKGRSDRELTFFKGDILTLYKRASDDWWEGNYKGRDGLVPHAYITVQEITDASSDVISSRGESEVSLDSGSTTQSPTHKMSAFVPNSNRRLSSEPTRTETKFPTKTKSLDRYNNVQEYIKQQKAMASLASKAAKAGTAGLASTPESSKVFRSGSVRHEKREDQDLQGAVDPASMSVAQRIARFHRSSSSSSGVDHDTIQKKGFGTLPRIIIQEGQENDIDDTMKNALDQLQALDVSGNIHKATPDVVLDTLENRSGQSVDSNSDKSHSNSSTLSSNDSKSGSKVRSGSWKSNGRGSSPSGFEPKRSFSVKQPSSNNNNNNNSHYQVPTTRYPGMARMSGRDFSSSAPRPSIEPIRLSTKYVQQQPIKQSVKKTAL